MNKILTNEFYNQPTINAAQRLIGKQFHFFGTDAIITETEAYIQDGDESCHASRGKTLRNATMFDDGGVSYVYLIYGMYHCINFVTESEGYGAAVLIRALKIDGVDYKETNGPGKLCRFLDITRKHNGLSLASADLHVKDIDLELPYETTERIGISKSKGLPWRFVVKKENLPPFAPIAKEV